MALRKPPLFLLLLIPLLAGCDLIPRRDEAANSRLYDAVRAEMSQLEAQGFINPDRPSALIVARYGTSFGRTIVLSGQGPNGAALRAADMVQACQQSTGTSNAGAVKRCLRQAFASGEPLDYSHAGLVFRMPGGQWQVRQSLRSRDTAIHQQWFSTLRQFVDIPLIDQRILIIVPDFDLQERLAQGCIVHQAGQKVITPVYNLVAGPYQTEEQMSNQFVLEVVASAMQPSDLPINRPNAQALLRSQGYAPTIIQLGGIQTLTKYDNLFSTIDLSAQPYARRYEIGELITVLSIQKFMNQTGRISAIRDVRLQR